MWRPPRARRIRGATDRVTTLFPILFGLTLGLGAMFTYRGLRIICSRGLGEEERRKGFWKLGAGLALAVLPVVLFMGLSGRW